MKRLYFHVVLFAIVVLFWGCGENGTVYEAPVYETLTEYLTDAGMDIDDVINGQDFLMEPPSDGDLSDKWIMDIRNASDFVLGHIEGAHTAGYKDILVAAQAADKPILIVDYTGEVASFAAILLRLYGYPDARALKWGMSGWNSQFDVWTVNCDDLIDESNWTRELREPGSYPPPELKAAASGGEAILKERVERVFAAGYKGIGANRLLENPSDYFINACMPLEDYLGFGHFNEAVQIYPLSIDNLNRINANREVVIYSYSGHISAAVTAYLNILGFDARNLKYGLNGITKSNTYWEEGSVRDHWNYSVQPKNLPVADGNN